VIEQRLHKCTVCGRVGKWGPSWSWYGSYRDIDEGRSVVKVCSDECRRQASRALKAEEADDG